ncbi:MAG: uracil-DNA glycosylase [Thermodesulfobacteriota bacterium]
MSDGQPPDQRVSCMHCQHFYITHEVSFPYGCRVMAFKSRQLPSITVRASSGMACQLFLPKKKDSRPGT